MSMRIRGLVEILNQCFKRTMEEERIGDCEIDNNCIPHFGDFRGAIDIIYKELNDRLKYLRVCSGKTSVLEANVLVEFASALCKELTANAVRQADIEANGDQAGIEQQYMCELQRLKRKVYES